MGKGGDAAGARPARAAPGSLGGDDFHWSKEEEPHALRKKAILAAHPEIKSLFGPCIWTLPQVIAVVSLQTYLSWWVQTQSTLVWIATAYLIGGFASHNLFLANHELCHNLAFERPALNRLLGCVANFPIVIPFSNSFTKYHLEHHRFQGHDGVDQDIPTYAEGNWITTTWGKAVVCFNQIAFYALRPTIMLPKAMNPWDLVNVGLQVTYDVLVYKYLGLQALNYLWASAYLGGGLHPIAGHFLSEHYVFKAPQETYSYYGPLNRLVYNVGYHNEHHDFPRIPGSRLPMVRKLAPEFYEPLAHYDSWSYTIWAYITDAEVGPFSRVMRFKGGKAKRT